jgi:uncharacterized protein with HEPN domain
MRKQPEIFLKHILESIDEAERHIKDITKDEFLKDVKAQDAVVRRLEIIGEAAKNLPATFKNKYPYVPWKKIAGTRNILVHEYFGVDLNLVWEMIKRDLPKLKKNILKILRK